MSGQTFEEFVRQEISYILDQHEVYQPDLEDDLVQWVVETCYRDYPQRYALGFDGTKLHAAWVIREEDIAEPEYTMESLIAELQRQRWARFDAMEWQTIFYGPGAEDHIIRSEN